MFEADTELERRIVGFCYRNIAKNEKEKEQNYKFSAS